MIKELLSEQEQRELHDALCLSRKRLKMQLWLITFMLDNIKEISSMPDNIREISGKE